MVGNSLERAKVLSDPSDHPHSAILSLQVNEHFQRLKSGRRHLVCVFVRGLCKYFILLVFLRLKNSDGF